MKKPPPFEGLLCTRRTAAALTVSGGFAAAAVPPWALAQVASPPTAAGSAGAMPAADAPRPLLAVENGSHSAPVRRIDAARGIAVTASDDRTARVWDLASGALRFVLRPYAFGAEGGRLYGVALHPQEPLVAVAGTTGGALAAGATHPHVIYLFDLNSGALQNTFDARAGDIRKLQWSADGQVLLAGYNGTHGVRAFARDGRELLDDRLPGPVFGLAVQGALAAAVGLDGSLRSYRLGGGRVERAATASLGARRPAGVALSADGRQLAVAYATRGEGIEIFDAATLQPLQKLPAPESFAGDWRVLAWSADGRTLALGGTAHTRELRFPVVTFDVATRAVSGRFDAAADSVTDLVALAGGGFAYASFDGSWGALAVPGQAEPRRVGAPVAAVRGNAPFDLELAADGLAARWGQRGPARGLSFAFDRRRLLAGRALEGVSMRAPDVRASWLSSATDWLNDGRPPVVGGRAMALAADERGRAVVVLGTRPAAVVIGTNRALHRIDETGQLAWRVAVDTEVRALNASADGRLLVAAMADGTLRWHRASDGLWLLSLLALDDGRWVAWTPNGYYDASTGADRIVGWALARGTAQAMDYFSLARFREQFNRPDIIDGVLATGDERTALAQIAARAEAERVALQQEAQRQAEAARQAERDALARAERARIAAQQEGERRAAAERATRDAAAAAEVARQAEAARLAAISQARATAEREATAAAAARAEADARAAAERQRQEREAALAAERERQRLDNERQQAELQARERERLAQEAAREAEERRRADASRRALAEMRATEFPPAVQGVGEPRLKVATGNLATLPFALHSHSVAGEVNLDLRAAGRPLAARELVLPKLLNGLTQGYARVELPVADGLNPLTIELIASNRYGHSEPLAFIIERELPPPPPGGWPGDLYVLAIGVAEYARPEYRLGLAAKDAADFATAMQKQEGRQYRRVVTRTLTNSAATKQAVLREFDWLRSSVAPTDTAMLFIAGHGVNDAQGQYFFMPHDAQHEKLLSTGVPQAAIVSTLAQIRGRTLMFIDTCFAGNALGALHKAPKKTERLINDLSASENGVIVFASSTGQEESLEKDSWGNGAFTKALLEGLGGRADFMRAGRVTYAALNLFVSEEVARLTDGRQRPVFISPRGVPDFAVARL
jgi:hypothetical protein